ncbi:MAG TPA: hypothetical protein PKV33_11295 [Methanothrix sp.]|nr:hypothetical protein [Methanothrix sp.]
MMIRSSGLKAILLLAFLASAFPVMASAVSAQEVLSSGNDTIAQNGAPNDMAIAQGLWKATLGEEEIIIAVNQSDQSLFGLAKFEGDDPWNAAVAGSVSGGEVSLSLAALKSDALASISINAALQGETMKGSFVLSDSNGKASNGQFTAEMINPSTSGYTPAVVAAAQKEADETEQVTQTNTEKTEQAPANKESTKAVPAKSEGRFKDVTKLAKGINPDILPRMAQL